MTATKHFSAGKLAIDQIPAEALAALALVYTYGEGKYGRDNWKLGKVNWSEWYGSAKRHLNAFWLGQRDDPESGLPHLAHAMWNVVALFYYEEFHLGLDNRNPAAPDFMSWVGERLNEIGDRVKAYQAAHPEHVEAPSSVVSFPIGSAFPHIEPWDRILHFPAGNATLMADIGDAQPEENN